MFICVGSFVPEQNNSNINCKENSYLKYRVKKIYYRKLKSSVSSFCYDYSLESEINNNKKN